MPALFRPRHYRFLVRTFAQVLNDETFATDRETINRVIDRLIVDFSQDNPMFSESRFRDDLREACEEQMLKEKETSDV